MKRMSNYLLLFHFSCLDNIDDNEEGDDKYVCTIYMLRIYFSKTGRRQRKIIIIFIIDEKLFDKIWDDQEKQETLNSFYFTDTFFTLLCLLNTGTLQKRLLGTSLARCILGKVFLLEECVESLGQYFRTFLFQKSVLFKKREFFHF